MEELAPLHNQLQETVRDSINALYERILDDGSVLLDLEVFRSLKDCQQSRDYIVLRIEQMVRDTVGADRRQHIQQLIEESTQCREQLEREKSSLEQAQQQVQHWRGTVEALRLENDRLKFEVVGCGQHAEQQIKRLREELQQARDSVNEARLRMQKAQAQTSVLAHELHKRSEQFNRKDYGKEEMKDQGTCTQEYDVKVLPISPVYEIPEQRRLQRSEVINSTIQKRVGTMQSMNTHSVKDLKPVEDGSDVIDEIGRASDDSRRLLQEQSMEYAKQVERLRRQLAQQQSKTSGTMAFMKTEFEKMKGEVKDYKRLKEADEEVRVQNERLHEQIRKLLIDRESSVKVQHTLQKQLAELKKLMNGETQRVQEMDTQVVRLNKINRNLEAELRQWKERLQRGEDIRSEQLDQLREQLRQAQLKIHLKEKNTHMLEAQFSKVRKDASHQLQQLIKENERLTTELSKQKQQSTRKISEIDRLNRDLKSMYERKIELMTSTSKEEHEKSQKLRSEARLHRDESRQLKARSERLEQEVKLLEEKLIQLTKTNSGLQKESRTTRNDCRMLERTNKEQEEKILGLSEALKQANHKLQGLKPKLKELQKKMFALDAHCEDTKFKLIEGGSLLQLQNQQTCKDVMIQLNTRMIGMTKHSSEETKLLQEQLSLSKAELRRSEMQQSEYLRLIQQLEERLASKQLRDSEELGNLEKQVADLQRLCRKLQEINNDNLREIEYLQKVRHEEKLEKQYKSPGAAQCEVSMIPTVQHLPSKELRERRQPIEAKDHGSMISSNTVVNHREVEELQRHYDKLIRTLEDENIKLRSETTRAEIMFEKELTKLNEMYRSRERLLPHSVQELPVYEDKPSARERKERSQNRDIQRHDLQRTREKAPSSTSERYLTLDRVKKDPTPLAFDIKRDIEKQKRRLEENRRNMGSYGDY